MNETRANCLFVHSFGFFFFALFLLILLSGKRCVYSNANINKVEIERDNDNIINVITSINSSGH